MRTPTILIVEDEEVTRFSLRNLFEAEGYDVLDAPDGESMHEQLKGKEVDLVVMDINLPGKNGLILARELRENREIGLIFLTGRDNDVDKILGLEIGADDYLVKPFNPRELTIRARNLLSRTMAEKQQEKVSPSRDIRFNEWVLEANSRTLYSPDNIAFRLPKSEYRALRIMLENPGEIFSREALIMEMTGRELRSNDRTVDVTIRRLRKHFESDPSKSELIGTIHGEGYRFIGEVDA